MRVKDEKRFIAMSEIKARASTLLTVAKQYETVFESTSDISADLQMSVLDKEWDMIVENQLALTNLIRQNGI